MRRKVQCAIAFTLAAVLADSAHARAIEVAASDDLQAALDGAKPGDTVLLQPGVTYVGHFVLRQRGSSSDRRPIIIRTAGNDPVAAGTRITPDAAGRLAKLKSPDDAPVLSTARGARYWTIQLVEFMANAGGAGDIIALGDGGDAQASADDVPSDLVLDRVYVHGDDNDGQKRGIALNSGRTVISNSYIASIKSATQDSQAIAGWNGPGPYVIENNYLEAAGENLMFGGADPYIKNLTPTDITIRGNTLSKPAAWRGQRWQVKNLLELKNARNVSITDNVLERNWSQAQSGYSVLFTPRNQDGRCPWCQVENVTFERNIIRDVAAGIVILGRDYLNPSAQTRGIIIRNNLFTGLDGRQWGGDGYLLQMTDEPREITIDHNTVIQGESGGIAKIDGVVEAFKFTNNITGIGTYGIIATAKAPGNGSIRAALPGSVITANVLAGGDEAQYPPGNFFPSLDDLRKQFMDPAAGDYRLKPSAPWTKSSDGLALGATLSPSPTEGTGGTAVPRDGDTTPPGGRRPRN